MFCSKRWVAKLCRSVCGDTRLVISAMFAAAWQARLSWRVDMGWSGSRPGNSQAFGRAMRHQSRKSSSNTGESIAWRSLRPLPCSIRSSMRCESMSDTFSAATSDTRRPLDVLDHCVEGRLTVAGISCELFDLISTTENAPTKNRIGFTPDLTFELRGLQERIALRRKLFLSCISEQFCKSDN